MHEFVYTLITENIIVMYTMQTSCSPLSLFLENNKLPEPMNNYSTKVYHVHVHVQTRAHNKRERVSNNYSTKVYHVHVHVQTRAHNKRERVSNNYSTKVYHVHVRTCTNKSP